jgi:uncharacterized protein (TIGR02599 family)
MIILSLKNSPVGRDEMGARCGSENCGWPAGGRQCSRPGPGEPIKTNRFSAVEKGFTLVELLVSTAIIALILLMLVQVTNNLSFAWRTTAEKVEKFQEARDGFEAMTRRISQATLNTYWDYYDVSGVTRNQSLAPGSFLPFAYGRQSDLRFMSGPMSGVSWSLTSSADVNGAGTQMLSYWPTHGIFFQAPLGTIAYADQPFYSAMDNMLNTWGYFIEVNSDADPRLNIRPTFLTSTASPPPDRWRARLMELQVPAEYMNVYDVPNAPTAGMNGYSQRRDWFLSFLEMNAPASQAALPSGSPLAIPLYVRPARALAENVLALIILPKLSSVDETSRKAQGWSMLSPDYTFDSTVVPLTANSGSVPTLLQAPVNPGAYVTSGTNASDAGGIDPRNQLPPEIQIVMIAIDERSAQRLLDLTNPGAGQNTTLTDPTFGGIYSSGTNPLFTQALTGGSNYTNQLGDAETAGTDLYAFTQKLVAQKLTYRIFSTTVTIRGAKWSKAQAD